MRDDKIKSEWDHATLSPGNKASYSNEANSVSHMHREKPFKLDRRIIIFPTENEENIELNEK